MFISSAFVLCPFCTHIGSVSKPVKSPVPSPLFEHIHKLDWLLNQTSTQFLLSFSLQYAVSTTRASREYTTSTLNIRDKHIQKLYCLYHQYQQQGYPNTIPPLPSIPSTRVSKDYTFSILNINNKGPDSHIPSCPITLYNTYTCIQCTTQPFTYTHDIT